MINLHVLDRFRVTQRSRLEFWNGWPGDETCGMFELPSPIDGQLLRVIASSGDGWDHVSVSRKSRCPNWPEMEHVASLFFMSYEYAFQFHVPVSEHINNHPYCLHWWRPLDAAIPLPPSIMVGVKSAGLIRDLRQAKALQREVGI